MTALGGRTRRFGCRTGGVHVNVTTKHVMLSYVLPTPCAGTALASKIALLERKSVLNFHLYPKIDPKCPM